MHHKYQIIVGNVGTVCETDSFNLAFENYALYKRLSILGLGRSADETVTFFGDDEIIAQHLGAEHLEENDNE